MPEPVAVPHKPLSVEEYLALEETSQRKHEYVTGEIYAHAGATNRPNIIAGNIYASLWNAARGTDCRVYNSDTKVRATEDTFYYPDVMVVCGDSDTGEDAVYQDAPCVIVEVTSPSTGSTDRREKLAAYKKIPSLKAYLIVSQEERRVERHWRDESGQWWQAEVADPRAVIPIPCPETGLTPAQVYEGL
jgi:Uma2 family endonuclease